MSVLIKFYCFHHKFGGGPIRLNDPAEPLAGRSRGLESIDTAVLPKLFGVVKFVLEIP